MNYDPNKPIATRKAFGTALAELGGKYPNLVVLDGDVKNSTYTEDFEKKFPKRFFQMYIAEQLMIGVATGLSRVGLKPVAATFACFLTRAHDQLRMAALSELPLVICGSHAGVSIGEDGPSQMGLEDIALFRSLIHSVVVYPSDAVSSEALVGELIKREKGVSYIRTTRPATQILYKKHERFPIGGSKTFDVKHPVATVIAAGITVHEALKAQKEVPIRVIDAYSVKPIDTDTLKKAAKETKKIIVVEDHYPEGGLGEAVMSIIGSVTHLAVRKQPRSGKADELLDYEGISASSIVRAIKSLQ